MNDQVRTYESAMDALAVIRERLRDLGLSYEEATDVAFDAYELGFDRANAIHFGNSED